MTEARARRSSTTAGTVAAMATVVGLLLFGYKALDQFARGYHRPLAVPLIEELTAAYGAALLLFGAGISFVRRVSRTARGRVFSTAIAHLVGAFAFSVTHTTLNWVSRSMIFALIGKQYDYGRMPVRYAMEAPMDLLVYVVFVASVLAVERQRRSGLRELESIRLEGRVLAAELRSLRAQLDPHFLFNALNTISSVMYDDPTVADEMIGHLSALLRASLRSADAKEVALGTDLELLEHYVALLHSRFGSKVIVAMDVEPGLEQCSVPPMLLQPLVENAVRHGSAALTGAGRIAITARSSGRSLELTVYDDGPGAPDGADPFGKGVGLSALRERLRLLYGERQQLHAANVADGGFRVDVVIPRRLSVANDAAMAPGVA